MKQRLIKTEYQYDEALERLREIFDVKANSKEGQEAELLTLLIENYELEYHSVEILDPIMAVKIGMKDLQPKQKDLVGIVGSKGIVPKAHRIDLKGESLRNRSKI